MIYRIIAVVFLLTSFLGCSRPDACIESTQKVVNLGQQVSFKNCSSSFDRADVNFGDGNSLTDVSENFQYAFIEPGSYTVRITALGKNDKSSTSEVQILVSEPSATDLEGVWRCYKEEEYNTVLSSFLNGIFNGLLRGFSVVDTRTFDPPLTYEFSGSQVTIQENGTTVFSFNITGGGLRIGPSNYQIMRLHNNELVIALRDPFDPFTVQVRYLNKQ